ncbi:hypothetical protein BJ912DRAFT_1045188 [Pholiota molesta]|nr:hypothetical protein BJ912DRAFT_1045188 [Pholiota molesta]
MHNFKVQQTVLLQDTNIPGSPWRVGRVIEIVNYLGTRKYIVDVEDHRGRIIYRVALPLDDERLRGVPLGYPEAYRWDPRQVGIAKRDFVRSEFVWAAVRVRRQYGVNQSSEVWVPAMYIEKVCPGRHCVLVVGGADADSDADPQAAIYVCLRNGIYEFECAFVSALLKSRSNGDPAWFALSPRAHVCPL